MAVDFVVYELALFLDTHPNDRRALEDHNNFARKSHQLRAMYEKNMGPWFGFGIRVSISIYKRPMAMGNKILRRDFIWYYVKNYNIQPMLPEQI